MPAARIPNFQTFGLGLLASAGVLSVLLGVAAQPVLGNIISGVQIAVSRPIEMKLDYLVDVDALREEYDRIEEESNGWDQAHEPKLEVVSFNDDSITVRAVVWSRNASAAWILSCEVREKLRRYLQKKQLESLPRRRLAGRLVEGRSNGTSKEQKASVSK